MITSLDFDSSTYPCTMPCHATPTPTHLSLGGIAYVSDSDSGQFQSRSRSQWPSRIHATYEGQVRSLGGASQCERLLRLHGHCMGQLCMLETCICQYGVRFFDMSVQRPQRCYYQRYPTMQSGSHAALPALVTLPRAGESVVLMVMAMYS